MFKSTAPLLPCTNCTSEATAPTHFHMPSGARCVHRVENECRCLHVPTVPQRRQPPLTSSGPRKLLCQWRQIQSYPLPNTAPEDVTMKEAHKPSRGTPLVSSMGVGLGRASHVYKSHGDFPTESATCKRTYPRHIHTKPRLCPHCEVHTSRPTLDNNTYLKLKARVVEITLTRSTS